MRIAFVSQSRDYIESAGTQRGSVAIVTWELARRLALRHSVVIYAPLGPDQALEERAQGLTIRRIPGVSRRMHRALDLATGILGVRPPYFAQPAYFRGYARAICKWLRSDPPDCIHLQVAAQFIPLFRDAVPTARIVLHCHDELLTHIDRSAVAPRIAMADAVVTCSDYITGRWQRHFEEFALRISTVRNGVDLTRFHPAAPVSDARDSAGGVQSRHEILYVGRVSPEKGVHVLASAFERVCASFPDARLSIVGPAGLLPFSHLWLLSHDDHVAALQEFYGVHLGDKLQRQILNASRSYLDSVLSRLSKRAAANVNVVGQVRFDHVPEFYRRASVLAAPSVLAEPFGLPLVEALACGLPVVASRAGGMSDIVTDGVNGRLVERGDVAGLSDALCQILADDSARERMRTAARAMAEARFSWDGSVEQLEAVYRGSAAAPAEPARQLGRLGPGLHAQDIAH